MSKIRKEAEVYKGLPDKKLKKVILQAIFEHAERLTDMIFNGF